MDKIKSEMDVIEKESRLCEDAEDNKGDTR